MHCLVPLHLQPLEQWRYFLQNSASLFSRAVRALLMAEGPVSSFEKLQVVPLTFLLPLVLPHFAPLQMTLWFLLPVVELVQSWIEQVLGSVAHREEFLSAVRVRVWHRVGSVAEKEVLLLHPLERSHPKLGLQLWQVQTQVKALWLAEVVFAQQLSERQPCCCLQPNLSA